MKSTAEEQKEKVRAAYGEIARKRSAGEAAACCAPPTPGPDYTIEEIGSVPKGAYLGEGSGNPVRAAELRPGETVVDLGSGAGVDVFLAANRVGRAGRVIGVDMTPEMLERARANAARGDYPQVEFLAGDIERLPVAAATADAVLSNCVINLAPDKAAVYREIFRVLKPGGRFAIADIVLRGEPGRIRRALLDLAPCSCVATALEENAYLATIRAAGFEQVEIVAERPAVSQPLDSLVRAQAVTLVGRKPFGLRPQDESAAI
jgi:SAM-dependent methyltransferase